jgi:hypothetical protein
MDVLHWDKIPAGTVFAVSQFREGLFKDMWGIKARLSDGRVFWVLMNHPAEVAAEPDRVAAQKTLTNLRSSSKMKASAEEKGDWGDDNPSGLSDPRTFPTVNWQEVPETVFFRGRQFRYEEIWGDQTYWGVVAMMPDGEHVVILDGFAKNAGYHTFSPTREEVQRVIDWLELTEEPVDPDPEIEARLRDATSPPNHKTTPFVTDEELGIKPEELAADLEEIDTIGITWAGIVKEGRKFHCLCPSCRAPYERELDEIVAKYEKGYGLVPSLILEMVEEVRAGILRSIQDRPKIDWHQI